ncbi:MAG: DNA adenine methylase [Roseobacter sp.]
MTKNLSTQPGTALTTEQVVAVAPFKTQLLKWVGNKQKFAHEIIAHFPQKFGTYFEPFLGSGAVLGTLAPKQAVASDAFPPLVDIWHALSDNPEQLKTWYSERYDRYMRGDRVQQYEAIKADYNARPNGADFLFLTRSCYGGVVRFRKKDGYMSTPCGAHLPMKPAAFARRVDLWAARLSGTHFEQSDFKPIMARAKPGDLVYCDPPYGDSQSILYGAQGFKIDELFSQIAACKARNVYVALSLDGTKKSGRHHCPLDVPDGLFEQEIMVNLGRSMLRRFQMAGQNLEGEQVHDRLLLSYPTSAT